MTLSDSENDRKIYQVFVQQNAHCNLDSLPLRFGFYFDSDQVIEVNATSNELEANRPDRFIIEGSIKRQIRTKKFSESLF